jgi:antitoxin VapB
VTLAQRKSTLPALNIKDPEAYKLAKEIAQLTGKSLTRVVIDALRKEYAWSRPRKVNRAGVNRVLARVRQRRGSHVPKLPDEIIEYNDKGTLD